MPLFQYLKMVHLSGARFDEPLIIGIDQNACFISSDVLGFLKYTDKAIFLDNRDIVIVDNSGMQLFDFDGNTVNGHPTEVAWELSPQLIKGDTHIIL